MNNKYSRPEVPEPAQLDKRKEPLPGHQPKSSREDRLARGKLDAILKSPTYIPAHIDEEFLTSDGTRGVRLQLDYMKTEQALTEHGIEKTIVVFGSTRLVEPATAAENVARLRDAFKRSPSDPELKRRLLVAERLLVTSRYYEIASEFARLVASAGDAARGSRPVIMTGGGPGIMEAANRGAHDAGVKTIGLNIVLPMEQYPNPYVTPELCFSFHYFALRKLHFIKRAKALVAFPGGFGTLDELFETLTLVQTRKIKPVPVILVGESWWRKLLDTDFLVEEGVIDIEDRDLFWFAETAEDIWEGLVCWYERQGEPLI
jgi:hypothetical protein